jgi:NAD(P)-dependent dehydrogenase (short-subunit alcohol dehydrogenase family)
LQAQLQASDLTVDAVTGLANNFIESVANNTYAAKGWPRSTYGVSKVLVTALSKVMARNLRDKQIAVFAMCPGWCRTDMAGPKATNTPEFGAETITYLATTPLDQLQSSGSVFFAEKAPLPEWFP